MYIAKYDDSIKLSMEGLNDTPIEGVGLSQKQLAQSLYRGELYELYETGRNRAGPYKAPTNFFPRQWIVAVPYDNNDRDFGYRYLDFSRQEAIYRDKKVGRVVKEHVLIADDYEPRKGEIHPDVGRRDFYERFGDKLIIDKVLKSDSAAVAALEIGHIGIETDDLEGMHTRLFAAKSLIGLLRPIANENEKRMLSTNSRGVFMTSIAREAIFRAQQTSDRVLN